jgi:ABC-type sugar transport system permease subunit
MSRARDPVWRFLLPSFVFVGIFSLYPILESFRLSFYRMILTLPWLGQKLVGWENYRDLITHRSAARSRHGVGAERILPRARLAPRHRAHSLGRAHGGFLADVALHL